MKKEVFAWLDIDVDYTDYFTQIPDPDDPWDAGERNCEYFGTTATLRETTLGPNRGELPKFGDWIYIVIEVCDEGCSYGHTSNVPRYCEWFKTPELAEEYTKVTPKDNDYFGGHVEWKIECVKVGGTRS